MSHLVNYSMCWEDPDILRKALKVHSRDTACSVASGGENVFALLLDRPKKMIVVDSEINQLRLVRLKMASIQQFSYDHMVEFLGFRESKRRVESLNQLMPYLSDADQQFWKNNLSFVKGGVIHSGKFEKYLALFRKIILSTILNKEQIRQYLSLTTLDEQYNFYHQHWDTLRWRILFLVFFSERMMKLLGRSRSYFEQRHIKHIGKHYYARASRGITTIPVQDNYFVQMILTGTISTPLTGHPYLDKKNFMKLKRSTTNIEWYHGTVRSVLNTPVSKNITKFNLSNIFETQSQERYESFLQEVAKKCVKGTRICYWNNLVSRTQHNTKNLKRLSKLAKTLRDQERLFFYSDFILEQVIK